MLAYVLRRLLLVVPTLFGILLVNFVDHPGGSGWAGAEGDLRAVRPRRRRHRAPHRRRWQRGGAGAGSNRGRGTSAAIAARRGWTRRSSRTSSGSTASTSRPGSASRPWSGTICASISARATSAAARCWSWSSDKMPVSISLGIWTTLLTYLIGIPLGIRKAVQDGTPFDVWTSTVIIVGYAIPAFLFAVLLIVLFAGGSYWQLFPLRGLVSDDFWSAALARQGAGLSLAHGAADHRADGRLVRDADHADQEQLPRGDQQAVRAHRPRQGPDPAPGPLRPRLPQRDAGGDRGLPGRVHRHAVHRLAC